MTEQSLNLRPINHARLRLRSPWDRNFAAVFRHRKSIVATLLISGDLLAALAAIWCTNLLIRTTGLASAGPRYIAAAVVVLTFSVVGLYTGSGPGPCERFRLRTIGIAGFMVIFSTIAGLRVVDLVSFVIVQMAFAASLLLIGHYVEAAVRLLLINLDLWGASAVLVGVAEDRRKLMHRLLRKPDLGLRPIGSIGTADLVNANRGLTGPVSGTTSGFGRSRSRSEVEVAIFTSAIDLAAVPRECRAFPPSCRFILLENINDLQGAWPRARTIDEMIGIEIRRDLRSWQSLLAKRIFDLLVAVPAGLFVLPVVIFTALMIKLVDPGPAFYVQKRIGRNGKIVNVFKLRTMCVDSERRLEEHLGRDPQARAEWQRFFKLRHDPRLLPKIGNFIRRSSIDELPQLWNVICGDMSLVGPRPLPPYHADKLDIEFRSFRASVPPGITGLWQVSSRSDGDLEVLREHDLFYIRNWSHWLDFYILLQTVPAVLGAKGAR